MLKKIILTGALAILALGSASITTAGIPDLSNSVVSWAYDGPGPLSLFNLPDGSGNPLNHAYLKGLPDGGPGTFVDATITLTLLDGNDNPIANFPFEDIWLESMDGGLSACIGGTTADFNSDFLGQTVWANPLRAGGWSQSSLLVNINGAALDGAGVPLMVNSPDINGDGVVNLADIGQFTSDYHSFYHFRSDFHFDGALNLSDVGLLAKGWGAQCP